MIGHFSIKLNQFEKIGSISKFYISLGNLKVKFHFPNRRLITFFVNFTLSLFDTGVCLPFAKGNEMKLKKKSKVKPQKNGAL